MNLQTQNIPLFISPPHLCTASRIIGEHKLATALRDLKGAESMAAVLDVGCGGGEYRFLFPGCIYTGIDVADNNFAPKSCENHHFLIGNAIDLPIVSDSQDIVYSSYAFEYFPDAKQALKEMYRVLNPGGVAIICLPTKWVVVYDFLSDLLRIAGINIGQVSAQPGVKYYEPTTIQKLAQDASFVSIHVIPVYGWPIFLLKAILSWSRVILHVSARIGNKFSKKKFGKNVPLLYVPRKVTSAQTYQEWEEILRNEITTCSPVDQAYLLLVNCISKLDKLIRSKPIVEYIMVLSKPINIGKL